MCVRYRTHTQSVLFFVFLNQLSQRHLAESYSPHLSDLLRSSPAVNSTVWCWHNESDHSAVFALQQWTSLSPMNSGRLQLWCWCWALRSEVKSLQPGHRRAWIRTIMSSSDGGISGDVKWTTSVHFRVDGRADGWRCITPIHSCLSCIFSQCNSSTGILWGLSVFINFSL